MLAAAVAPLEAYVSWADAPVASQADAPAVSPGPCAVPSVPAAPAGGRELISFRRSLTVPTVPAEPVGFNRAILLVTRQPIEGFSGGDTLTTPVSTALDGAAFVRQLNGATNRLPRRRGPPTRSAFTSWADTGTLGLSVQERRKG